MTMPTWWEERRFGLVVHASSATVPAFAPIGADAEGYRNHLGEGTHDVAPHVTPVVEVLAHHRNRWGHISSCDDFVPLLTFDRFDADEWAELARDAGAGYAIHVARHHDGWTWWDAPDAPKRMTEHGPCRDVVAEFAGACARHDVVFGTRYAFPDPGDDLSRVDRHVLDLVERVGTSVLWGHGHQTHDADDRETARLMERVREIDPRIVINDRWWASRPDVAAGGPDVVTTHEYHVPGDVTSGPWMLCRSVGSGDGHNRNDRPEHHLTGRGIVDLFTEVVAKGGHLLLGVGPAADGTIPRVQSDPLRDAGDWIRRVGPLLAGSRPWTTWGDRDVRYLDTGDALTIVDVAGRGWFPALGTTSYRVSDVTALTGDCTWVQHVDGLHVEMSPRGRDPRDDRIGVAVYRVWLVEVARAVGLFTPVEPRPTPLQPLLADASPGDVVQLGDGTYVGPVIVPAGVCVRGLGAARTRIVPPGQGTAVPGGAVVRLGRDARLEHVSVHHSRTGRRTRSSVHAEQPGASVLGCTVDGAIEVTADDVLIRAVSAQGVVAVDSDRLHVSRCRFSGNGWDVGADLCGGDGHEVESNEFDGHLCSVRTTGTAGSTIRGNTLRGRWYGVHLDHSEDSHVHGNRIRSTMRAVDVEGGRHAVVDGNAVTDGDSGCIVEDGAAACEVYGNHWDRCRIGLLAWGATDLHHQDNVCSGLHDADGAHVVGP